jgi:hypothetical protein
MEKLKQIFKKEINSDALDLKKEKKKIKGFIPEGKKLLHYSSTSLVEVYEVESGIEYFIDYLLLYSIIEVMGFDERRVEMSRSKLLNGYSLIIDFDQKKVGFYLEEEDYNFIGSDLIREKQDRTGVYGDEDVESDTFSAHWYNLINKN